MSNYEIKLKINDENELYNSLDETQNTLSEKVSSYIEKELSKKERADNIIIKIKCSQNIDIDKFEKAYTQFINDKIKENHKNKKFNIIKQIKLIIVGIIFITTGILIGAILNTILYTIISTIGSFAIWEASNIWLIKNNDLDIEKMRLNNLLNIKTEFYKQ